MLPLRNLRDRLGFTPAEVRAVLLLSIALVAGHAIRSIDGLLPRRSSPDLESALDYRALDSIFIARSVNPPTDPRGATGQNSDRESPALPVNINTANVTQLASLPGIGPVYAERIIAHREANGPYRRVEDLLAISGIGRKRLTSLRGLIVLE